MCQQKPNSRLCFLVHAGVSWLATTPISCGEVPPFICCGLAVGGGGAYLTARWPATAAQPVACSATAPAQLCLPGSLAGWLRFTSAAHSRR